MPNRLLEPLLETGIRNTNYFNGRILTAEDLKTDQVANRRQHAQIATTIGDGIAYGLEVTAEANGTSVKVKPGLAINRLGQMLELLIPGADAGCSAAAPTQADGVTLDLTDTTDTSTTTDAGIFGLCDASATAGATLSGVSVLAISQPLDFEIGLR